DLAAGSRNAEILGLSQHGDSLSSQFIKLKDFVRFADGSIDLSLEHQLDSFFRLADPGWDEGNIFSWHQAELEKDAPQEEIRARADSAAANDFSPKFSRGFDRGKSNELIGQCTVGGNRDDRGASHAGADNAGAGIGREVDIASTESREGNAACGNAYELHVQTVFFIQPELLGDPKRCPVASERTVGNNQRLEFLLLSLA